jgi:hypothetical protein
MDNMLRIAESSLNLHSMYFPGQFADSLAVFKGKVGDSRFVNRFVFGVPGSLADLLAAAANQENTLEAVLGKIMAASMMMYFPLEHGWFLTTAVKDMAIDGAKWSLWSCRFWLLYVVCDLVLLGRKLQQLGLALEAKGLSTEERKALLKARQDKMMALSCEISDGIIAVQYSSASGGVFSDKLVLWAIWYGGVAGMWKRWVA